MKLKAAFSKMTALSVVACVVAVGTSSPTLAHVTIKPGEVATATYQVFTVNVPNEKTIPTVSVKVDVPEGVTNVTPTQKSGWKTSVSKRGTGETATVTAVTWSGGEITDGLRDEFTFSAKTPEESAELQWNAYQTYSDGTVVSWNEEKSEDSHNDKSNSGPFSITNVTDNPTDNGVGTTDENNSQATAELALYIAGAATILSIAAVFLATRKK